MELPKKLGEYDAAQLKLFSSFDAATKWLAKDPAGQALDVGDIVASLPATTSKNPFLLLTPPVANVFWKAQTSSQEYEAYLKSSALQYNVEKVVAHWRQRTTWLSQHLRLQDSDLFKIPIPRVADHAPGSDPDGFVYAGLFDFLLKSADQVPENERKSLCWSDDELHHRIFTNGLYNVMINVSGWGKTRRIFEMLTRHYGIYLCCSKERDSRATALPNLIDSFSLRPREREGVQHYFHCLVKANVLLLNALQKEPNFTPADWLAIQLFGADVFDNAVETISSQLRAFLPLKLPELCASDVVVVIDEAQEIGKKKEYPSTNGEPNARTLLQVLATGLVVSQARILLSGTSLSLSKRDLLNLFTILPDTELRPFSHPSPFLEPANLKAFFGKILKKEPTAEQFEAAFRILKGRSRFTAVFLRKYLESGDWNKALHETKFILVEKFTNLLADRNLRIYNWSRLLIPFYLDTPVTEPDENDWKMLENGFSEVWYLKNDLSERFWQTGIQEPLVLTALHRSLPGEKRLLKYALGHNEDSTDRGVQGKLFEDALAIALFYFFSGPNENWKELFRLDKLVAGSPQFVTLKRLSGVLDREKSPQLWLPSGFDQTCRVVHRQRKNEDLEALLADPPAPFVFAQPLEGPDMIFFLVSKTGKRVPCFVQSKTRIDSFHQAVTSLGEACEKFCKNQQKFEALRLRIATDFDKRMRLLGMDKHAITNAPLLRLSMENLAVLFGEEDFRTLQNIRGVPIGETSDGARIKTKPTRPKTRLTTRQKTTPS
eukprot:TRINITY_DN1251_c0_g1_i17.p1 TRINITY_DN1251_c0_g1~~TRINITY_DN1251_c0_g1_i17.p1  ORF type:complete len:789 (-),score=165.13 TRINITY_DN1251_c0_g1_i17:96-2417(-)